MTPEARARLDALERVYALAEVRVRQELRWATERSADDLGRGQEEWQAKSAQLQADIGELRAFLLSLLPPAPTHLGAAEAEAWGTPGAEIVTRQP